MQGHAAHWCTSSPTPTTPPTHPHPPPTRTTGPGPHAAQPAGRHPPLLRSAPRAARLCGGPLRRGGGVQQRAADGQEQGGWVGGCGAVGVGGEGVRAGREGGRAGGVASCWQAAAGNPSTPRHGDAIYRPYAPPHALPSPPPQLPPSDSLIPPPPLFRTLWLPSTPTFWAAASSPSPVSCLRRMRRRRRRAAPRPTPSLPRRGRSCPARAGLTPRCVGGCGWGKQGPSWRAGRTSSCPALRAAPTRHAEARRVHSRAPTGSPPARPPPAGPQERLHAELCGRPLPQAAGGADGHAEPVPAALHPVGGVGWGGW